MTSLDIINNNHEQPDGSWKSINWAKANRVVNNLSRRIFTAKQQGKYRTLRNLQRLLIKAYSNRLLAVRRVSQINTGRKTPGVDKKVYLTPTKQLVCSLNTVSGLNKWKAIPAKRIDIPKSKGKQRTLGIPTLTDRALQAIVGAALEPEWEAQFEGCSYGFRPKRSCWDAIGDIFTVFRAGTTKQWILDADIQGCNISHSFLLNSLNTFPGRNIISKWVKAGYMKELSSYTTNKGIPQGITPLLSNIALHGMEDALGITHTNTGRRKSDLALIRYADDFLVACKSKEAALEAKRLLNRWLAPRGLQLSETKTRILHIEDGFDFLGFNVRQYLNKGKRKLLIKPSKESIQKFRTNLKKVWKGLRGHPVTSVLSKTNPIIRGWANYFKIGVSKKVFSGLDHWLFGKQFRWAKRMHPQKGRRWLRNKYWSIKIPKRQDRWVFGYQDSVKGKDRHMVRLAWTPIKRHTKVKGSPNPFPP